MHDNGDKSKGGRGLRGGEFVVFLPFVFGKPLNEYFCNSEDPDEMQHNAAFHQGLHCL